MNYKLILTFFKNLKALFFFKQKGNLSKTIPKGANFANFLPTWCTLIIFMVCCSCVTNTKLKKEDLFYTGPKQKWEQTQHFFLWGLVPHANIKAYQVCPNSTWQSVTISRSFGHVMLSILTLGLYVPVYVTLVCPAATAAESAGTKGFPLSRE